MLALVSLGTFGLFWYIGPEAKAAGATPPTEIGSPADDRLELRSTILNPVLAGETLPPQQAETDEIVSIFRSADEAMQRALENRPSAARLRNEVLNATIDELEAYIERNSLSAWVPSLRVELGVKYRGRGQITRALSHWEGAWNATRHIEDGVGKLIADQSLIYRARLLASLGRKEELGPLVQEHQYRPLADARLAQIWARTIEAYVVMHKAPGLAYRCGTFALHNASKAHQGRHFTALWDTPSSTNGFSVGELSALSEREGLGLAAAIRNPGASLIVPAVVHWKQNHYAAITESSDGLFRVQDPTMTMDAWMDFSAIDEEASGFFLVPNTVTLPAGWRYAAQSEAARVYGKGVNEILDDGSEAEECEEDPECCEPGGGPEGTGSGELCGMAEWSVQEPNINLMVSDIPMAYERRWDLTSLLN
ncbi:MAG TPA: hypothetical protein VF773_10750 [Verrucomicrobiae bacterium]